jgi:hypothetical protein
MKMAYIMLSATILIPCSCIIFKLLAECEEKEHKILRLEKQLKKENTNGKIK